MLARAVGIAATCALGASAFLIPAGIAHDDLSTTWGVDPKGQTITLPCSDCAFPSKQEKVAAADEEDLVWIQGGANSLVLNFTVSEDGHALQLDGRVIYPVEVVAGRLSVTQQPLYVKQVPAETGLVDIKSGSAQSTDLEVTAYGLEVAKEEPLSPHGDNTLLTILIDIMGLENERVHLDEVYVNLLQTDAGELLITAIDIEPNRNPDAPYAWPVGVDAPRPPPPQQHGPPHHRLPHRPNLAADCDVLPSGLCKLKALIDSKISQATSRHGSSSPKNKGGCRGRKGPPGTHLPTHIKPHLVRPDHEGGRPNFHHGRPHHMRPHGPHHGHHGHRPSHSFWHGFADGLVAVLIPIMAGVAVGMVASLMGLVIGRSIAYVWIKVARGGRRGSASGVAVVEDGESEAMLAKMEPPPVYEDAPAYEENEKELV